MCICTICTYIRYMYVWRKGGREGEREGEREGGRERQTVNFSSRIELSSQGCFGLPELSPGLCQGYEFES